MKRIKRSIYLLPLILLILVVSLFFSACTSQAGAPAEKNPKIKLVLTIVIDQFRAGMIARHQHRLRTGGFNYLIQNGAWYKEAYYPYCTTLTAVGHASIYTGATPTGHGIIGNYWIDKQNGTVIKSIEGACPERLTGTTIGDELVLASGSRSRVFSVSLKDRGAILPGGFLGKAFWYNIKNGEFQTSAYYYSKEKLPVWLSQWNTQKNANKFKQRDWTLLDPNTNNYVFADDDDRQEEKTYNTPFNRSAVFPHSLKSYQGEEYYSQLRYTPFVDRLTMEFAQHLVREEQVGQKGHLDMLAVSFSATDYIGHAYGPNSLEYEDNLLQLDETLARLFNFIDAFIGLDHTLIVLTSDHGVDLIPEYRQRLHMPAGRVNTQDFKTSIDWTLQKKYNTTQPFFLGFRNPSIYLNLQTIASLGLDIREVESEAARVVNNIEGIAAAVTRTDLLHGRVADSPSMKRLKAAFHPKRSGNILVYQEPFYFLYHVHDQDSSMHGAPYSYDTHVPLFISFKTIKPQVIYRRVSPLDIVSTLSHFLNTAAPSANSGTPLYEAF